MIHQLKRMIGLRSPIRLGYHWTKAATAALAYGFPAKRCRIIGITGSDGKTTTVSMVQHILQSVGGKSASLTTASFQINSEITWNDTQKTSPSPWQVQQFLRQAVQAGCSDIVLEYSSHGLVQHRTDFTWPTIAAITNISREHLDYHGTMEQYIRDKGILFRMVGESGSKVLHLSDDTFAVYSAIKTKETIVYDRHSSDADLHLSDIQSDSNGSSAILHYGELTCGLTLSIPGLYNLDNALCAVGVAIAAGISASAAADALASFQGAPGRFEKIDAGQPFTVIVDFTVTPNAYRQTLTSARAIAGDKRLLVLTGSCGDRMKEKRPEIGAVCSDLADVVTVTNEDPYSEDPQQIIDQVWAGVDQSQCEAHQIPDRKEAITYLLQQAQPGDVVLLCGKGADSTMWTANGQIPWNEREITRQILADLA